MRSLMNALDDLTPNVVMPGGSAAAVTAGPPLNFMVIAWLSHAIFQIFLVQH